jgi:2-keto-4-pentenoate hydratase
MREFDRALEEFWAARNGGPYPLAWEPRLRRDDAYRLNLALARRHAERGEPAAGWKVGLTARSIREQFGLPEPVFALLFEHGRWPSGGTSRLADIRLPGWENELCLTLGRALKGPNVSVRDAAAAVEFVQPAMEIIETRGPNSLAGFNVMIADNGQQRAFVVGDKTRFDPARHDLGRAHVQVFVDGQFRELAFGEAVMESSPLASVAWLANKLAAFGLGLEAGQCVMTGSFTRQYKIDRPMTAEARFHPFGAARWTFS